jgi:hypothetical protein
LLLAETFADDAVETSNHGIAIGVALRPLGDGDDLLFTADHSRVVGIRERHPPEADCRARAPDDPAPARDAWLHSGADVFTNSELVRRRRR